jgi:hypothetical protein
MRSKKESVFTEDPPVFLLKKLTVRALEAHEFKRAGEIFNEEHYLGDLPTGRCLLQVVEYEGHWVALLDWGPAAHKLSARDEWIGWTGQQRAERLNLVVMNRRFLITGKTRMPNLASKSLSLALKVLPEQWNKRYGYKPLLAETFTDIEQFNGTCYKASNWIECGHSKGFKKHRIDYYQKHDFPKKLWLKTLNRNTRVILTGMDLPSAYHKARNLATPERDLPLKREQMESFREYLRKNFKDPRKKNTSFSASSLLTFVAMALFAGRDNMASIHRYGQFLSPAQRECLGFPLRKNRKTRKIPSYTAIRNLLIQIDPHDFAKTVSGWLEKHNGTLPRALAIDGKWIRDRALSLCLSEHESGTPAAIGFAAEKPKSEAYKKEGEQSVALKLYKQSNLENAVVTADALYCNKPQTAAVLKAGGDYFFQLKNENRHAYKNSQKIAQSPPLFATQKNQTLAMDDLINAT